MSSLVAVSSLPLIPSREQGARTNFIQSVVVGVVLTALSYLVAVQAGWVSEVNYLEVFAVLTAYSCTFLCVVERRINYPIGAVSNAAFSLLFFQYGLYASSITTGYLTFALIYGWFRWSSDADTRPVTRVQLAWVPLYILATFAFYVIALAIVNAVGGTLATTDTAILIGTMLAQFLLDNKKIETWFVWMAVNVFAIYTYANVGLQLTSLQYVLFLANAFYGLWMWKQSMNKNRG